MFQVSSNTTGGIISQFFSVFESMKPLLFIVIGLFLGFFIIENVLKIFMGRLAEKRKVREEEEKKIWTGKELEVEIEKGIETAIQKEVDVRARAYIKVRIEEYFKEHEKEIEAIIAKRLPTLT